MALTQHRNTLPIKRDRPSDAFFELCDYKPYKHQRDIHNSRALIRTVSIARQHGKSTLAMIEACYELCTKPNTTGYVVAPVYSQAQIIFRQVVQLMLMLVPKLPHLKITQLLKGTDMRIKVSHYDPNTGEYLGDAIMEGKSSNNPDTLRGGTTNWIIVDEAAMVSEEALTQGLIPTGTTTKPWMLFISTPKGTNNWFYSYYVRGQDPAYNKYNPDMEELYASWLVGGIEAGIMRDEFFVEKKRTNTEFVYKQEYLAEFLSDSGSVFIGVEELDKYTPETTTDTTLYGMKPIHHHTYYIGADFARYNDFSVFVVIDSTTNTVVRRVRLNAIDFRTQLDTLAELSREYYNCLIVADITGMGIPIVEQITGMGIPCEGINISQKTKDELISKLSLGIQNKYLTIMDDSVMINELKLFSYKKTESGSLKMAASTGHDDCVIALGLAWWHCSSKAVMPELNEEPDFVDEYSFEISPTLL